MRKDEPLMVYQLTAPVDFQAALDRIEVDYLTVDADRILVIFRRAVLNVEVCDGDSEAAERVAIEVLDSPPHPVDKESTLIEQFLDHLETDWAEVSSRN